MPKVGRRLMAWDECEIVDNEVKCRLQEQAEGIKRGYLDPEEAKSEQELREKVWSDSFLFEMEWEYLTDCLTEVMQKKNPNGYWKVVGRGLGWRRLDGYKYCRAETGRELLRSILPDTDCTFTIYNYGKGLAIRNAHHDAPTGEWYYILPCAQSTYEKFAC